MPPKLVCGFCTCKFCLRSNKDTRNPWLPLHMQDESGKLMLQFRRERGKECSSCCALIRTKKRDFYGDPNLDQTLRNDPEKREIYSGDLEEFEEKKRQETESRVAKPSKRVEATHASGFKMRMIMGYFWPLDVLKRENKPIPKTLTTITYNGKNLKGVILDASHGTPIGVIEMESFDEKAATKATWISKSRHLPQSKHSWFRFGIGIIFSHTVSN